MEEGNKKERIIIIGAGPVGALAALYAAQRDYEVEIYELRSDLRLPSTTPLNFTKSINLALSERGINAIRQSGCPQLLENIMKETIPMKGRMIHGKDISGALFEQSQDYDIHGRAIHAVDRGGLNKALLDELEAMPNVQFFFNHKLTGADFRNNKAWFEVHGNDSSQSSPNARDQEVEVAFDLLIGADGAHSAARYHLMKFVRMDYQQEYIDTLWCEFQIPANEVQRGNDPESRFRISPNHLHIWPGKEFMFIAIPSLDGSFTSTLFLPSSYFNELESNPSSLPSFFDTHFPGVTSIIPPSDLIFSFTTNPHLPLISIKCHPYHFSSSGVIVGDAAHAMVPFYGQGMNSGLEDVRVLFSILDKHAPTTSPTSSSSTAATPVMRALIQTTSSTTNPSPKYLRALALTEYSTFRQPDAYTINDLALQNYTEMRSSVVSPIYKLRKWAEEKMSIWLPSSGWQTKYSRVSFGNQRYSEVVENSESQGRVLVSGLIGVAISPVVVAGLIGWYRWRNGLRRLWG